MKRYSFVMFIVLIMIVLGLTTVRAESNQNNGQKYEGGVFLTGLYVLDKETGIIKYFNTVTKTVITFNYKDETVTYRKDVPKEIEGK